MFMDQRDDSEGQYFKAKQHMCQYVCLQNWFEYFIKRSHSPKRNKQIARQHEDGPNPVEPYFAAGIINEPVKFCVTFGNFQLDKVTLSTVRAGGLELSVLSTKQTSSSSVKVVLTYW